MSYIRMQRNLIDIFYHIRQLVACVAKLVLGCSWDTHFGGRGGRRRRGSAMAPFERAVVVSYRLSIVTTDYCAMSNHSAAICHRMSPTIKPHTSLRGKI